MVHFARVLLVAVFRVQDTATEYASTEYERRNGPRNTLQMGSWVAPKFDTEYAYSGFLTELVYRKSEYHIF
jgi:hypothetical protein